MSEGVELTRATVLVVDDIAENITILDEILRSQYKVRVARNGARALELAAAEPPPDLILLDVMMPDMDGYEVCRRLKADPDTAKIPVVFVTAMGEVEDESRGFSLGAVDYITKPVSPPIVRARVKTQLALYDQTRLLEGLVSERTRQLQHSRLDILWRLGKAGEMRDEDTGNHVVRVSLYSRVVAEGLGLDAEQTERIFLTSPLHDVGKIAIPDVVLLKPGRLTEAEWSIMRTHCDAGEAILHDESAGFRAYLTVTGQDSALHDSNPLLDTAQTIAATHHEQWSGGGYPKGLSGEEIPIEGRIVAIADVYDALSSVRPYKPAYPEERVIRTMAESVGTHFDPDVHAVFEKSKDTFRQIREQYGDRDTWDMEEER